jgi:hypothetical protein
MNPTTEGLFNRSREFCKEGFFLVKDRAQLRFFGARKGRDIPLRFGVDPNEEADKNGHAPKAPICPYRKKVNYTRMIQA